MSILRKRSKDNSRVSKSDIFHAERPSSNIGDWSSSRPQSRSPLSGSSNGSPSWRLSSVARRTSYEPERLVRSKYKTHFFRGRQKESLLCYFIDLNFYLVCPTHNPKILWMILSTGYFCKNIIPRIAGKFRRTFFIYLTLSLLLKLA